MLFLIKNGGRDRPFDAVATDSMPRGTTGAKSCSGFPGKDEKKTDALQCSVASSLMR